MDKTQKQQFVKELNETLTGSESIVVAQYRGLSVSQMTEYRASAREEGNTVQVAKNRLAKIAFEGTPYTNLNDLMTGPTVLTMASDAISAAKVAQKFADSNENFVILGGAMGDKALDQAGVKALSKMPNLDEARAMLLGMLQAPQSQFVRTINEPASMLARVLDAKSKAA